MASFDTKQKITTLVTFPVSYTSVIKALVRPLSSNLYYCRNRLHTVQRRRKNVRTTCVPDTLVCGTMSSFFGRIPSRCAYNLKHVRKQFGADIQFVLRCVLTRHAESQVTDAGTFIWVLEHRTYHLNYSATIPFYVFQNQIFLICPVIFAAETCFNKKYVAHKGCLK